MLYTNILMSLCEVYSIPKTKLTRNTKTIAKTIATMLQSDKWRRTWIKLPAISCKTWMEKPDRSPTSVVFSVANHSNASMQLCFLLCLIKPNWSWDPNGPEGWLSKEWKNKHKLPGDSSKLASQVVVLDGKQQHLVNFRAEHPRVQNDALLRQLAVGALWGRVLCRQISRHVTRYMHHTCCYTTEKLVQNNWF